MLLNKNFFRQAIAKIQLSIGIDGAFVVGLNTLGARVLDSNTFKVPYEHKKSVKLMQNGKNVSEFMILYDFGVDCSSRRRKRSYQNA